MVSLSWGNGVEGLSFVQSHPGGWCSVVLPGCLSFVKLAVSSVVVGVRRVREVFQLLEQQLHRQLYCSLVAFQDGTCWRSPITSVSRSAGFLLYWKNSCWWPPWFCRMHKE